MSSESEARLAAQPEQTFCARKRRLRRNGRTRLKLSRVSNPTDLPQPCLSRRYSSVPVQPACLGICLDCSTGCPGVWMLVEALILLLAAPAEVSLVSQKEAANSGDLSRRSSDCCMRLAAAQAQAEALGSMAAAYALALTVLPSEALRLPLPRRSDQKDSVRLDLRREAQRMVRLPG